MNTHESLGQGKIELETAGLTASINPNGAYLETLTHGGTDLLLPRQAIDSKDRGGMPICAPIFGPGGQTGLNQHGFARNLDWQIESQQANGTELKVSLDEATCIQKGIPEKYVGCDMRVSFMLGSVYADEYTLTTNLKITNNSQNIIAATPGFHPYFPIESGQTAESVAIGGKIKSRSFNAQTLNDSAQLPEPTSKTSFELGLDSNKIQVSMTSDTLMNYVIWSASPDKYICVEPTLAGFAANERSISELEQLYGLQPRQSKEYTLQITWGI